MVRPSVLRLFGGFVAIAVVSFVFAGRGARAAQTDIAISMQAPGAAPRILGPGVVGSRPGTPFLYTVPATGQAPLTFAATGLPAGLALGASTGTISGTTPAAGTYAVTLTASNAVGSVTAKLNADRGRDGRPHAAAGVEQL